MLLNMKRLYTSRMHSAGPYFVAVDRRRGNQGVQAAMVSSASEIRWTVARMRMCR